MSCTKLTLICFLTTCIEMMLLYVQLLNPLHSCSLMSTESISLCVFKTGDKCSLSPVVFKIHNKTSFQKFALLVGAAIARRTRRRVQVIPDGGPPAGYYSQRHINTTLFPNLMDKPVVPLSATMMMKICTSD